LVYTASAARGLETYVDADFAGGWDSENADGASTLYSQTGFVVKYIGCTVYWKSRLRTEIALSTAKADYIAMSQTLRETITIMSLTKEINVVFSLHIPEPKFVVKVHEDNQSCIAMASNLNFTLRTKHIAIKYHHFRKHVKNLPSPMDQSALYIVLHRNSSRIFYKANQ
jgi:hypothetical protein